MLLPLKSRLFCFAVLALLCYAFRRTDALDNGLVRKPPMGWIPWARFACQVDCNLYPNNCINEQLFVTMAEILASAYKQLGWTYINLDDCWSEKFRNPQTHALVANATRFPRGLKWLSDHVHSLGLKFGIYGDIGKKTCQMYPGFQDENNSKTFYFALDSKTFADWNIDFLKVDGCYGDIDRYDDLYPELGLEMNKTGQPSISFHFHFNLNLRSFQQILTTSNFKTIRTTDGIQLQLAGLSAGFEQDREL